jgi:hypothetical protein
MEDFLLPGLGPKREGGGKFQPPLFFGGDGLTAGSNQAPVDADIPEQAVTLTRQTVLVQRWAGNQQFRPVGKVRIDHVVKVRELVTEETSELGFPLEALRSHRHDSGSVTGLVDVQLGVLVVPSARLAKRQYSQRRRQERKFFQRFGQELFQSPFPEPFEMEPEKGRIALVWVEEVVKFFAFAVEPHKLQSGEPLDLTTRISPSEHP